MSDYLENNWIRLTRGLPANDFYQKLKKLYTSEDRHYHSFDHIEALLKLSEKHRNLLTSPKTVDFAIWYHDAIYDPSKSTNEEESAELARKDLMTLGVEIETIEECCSLIIATKSHQLSNELDSFDAQFLLDIDLSILAADDDRYDQYALQIREEYRIYPDELYKPGRKKVLLHFLEMKHIFKTELFQNLWEERAKENLHRELAQLELS